MNEKKYDNRNSFVLFPKHNANPKAPTHTGTYTDGENKEWEISAWTKTSKNGGEFFTGKISEKRERKAFTPHDKAKGNAYQPQDEDIDF